jgi:two-component system NtrC family response regulator
MNLASNRKNSLDARLLEIEELYRQGKSDIAGQQLQALISSGYEPDVENRGVFKSLVANFYLQSGDYDKAVSLGEEAYRLMASTAYHKRVGRVQWLLYKAYADIGKIREAEIHIHDAYASFRRCDDREGMIDALSGMGRLAYDQSDFVLAKKYVMEAIELSRGENLRMVRLVGNLGRIEIFIGDWTEAESHLRDATRLAHEMGRTISIIRGHLSLGYLYLRQRQFIMASRELKSAALLLKDHPSPVDENILMEYEGELALEMGDVIRAKTIITEACSEARKIAPDSNMVSQNTRRLAQIEMELDNHEEALKLAQKALDLANKLGEAGEIGLSQILIASIFSMRGDHDNAVDHALDGLDILRKVGDQYDIARSLLTLARIYINCGDKSRSKIEKTYDEAFRLFNKLKLFYWSAETRFQQGVYFCHKGDISFGFRKLHEAEAIFDKISERTKIRSVRHYLQDLSRKAVELAVSPENEFKIFGNYFSDSEYRELKSGQIEEIIRILSKRTGAHRIIVYNNKNENSSQLFSSIPLTDHQKRKFVQQLSDLLGEEINTDKPTLLLDCRRDPFINELLKPDVDKAVATVIVTPLLLGGEVTGYIYLDRQSSNGNLTPFGQNELNFVVGFADLISFKVAEYDKVLLEEDNKRLKAQLLEEAVFPNILTRNKAMLEMLSRVQQVVDSSISISITGETGCGKDLLAKTIHYSSNRREKRFISVNCAALPETLLESELFGHKKGAFTGADRDKTGLFEEADGGTFFLDEIADMPLSIQAKVLRILEEKEIVRLGETKPRKVDVRIISATNKDLKTEMEGGRFRSDLYYRLTALCFPIPPLRDRKEDIPLLVNHFAEGRVKFTPETMRYLIAFDWPGNVRELENEVKKLVLLAGESGPVEPALLSGKILSQAESFETENLDIDTNINFNKEFSLYDYLAEYEKRFIIQALRNQGGIKKHAAAFLNIPESTLRLKIKQYDIDLKNINTIH